MSAPVLESASLEKCKSNQLRRSPFSASRSPGIFRGHARAVRDLSVSGLHFGRGGGWRGSGAGGASQDFSKRCGAANQVQALGAIFGPQSLYLIGSFRWSIERIRKFEKAQDQPTPSLSFFPSRSPPFVTGALA